jgi:hypothetical protein
VTPSPLPSGVLINQTAANRLWAVVNPIGRRVAVGRQSVQVIGVAKDAYTTSLGVRFFRSS